MARIEKSLLPGEEIGLSKLANLWVRPSEYGLSEFAFAVTGDSEAIGGKAHLTNYRLIFAAHGINRLQGIHSIFLANVRQVRKGWTSLHVETETREYDFVMWFNRRFYEAIERERQAFGPKELRRLQSLVQDNLPAVSKGLQANELANAINGFFLGLQQPFSALGDLFSSMSPEEQSSVLEVVSLLKQRQEKRKK
jgi:hypothetical protein